MQDSIYMSNLQRQRIGLYQGLEEGAGVRGWGLCLTGVEFLFGKIKSSGDGEYNDCPLDCTFKSDSDGKI